MFDRESEFVDVSRALDNWAQWSNSGGSNLGYPGRAIAISTGGGYKTTDDFCRSIDRHEAEVIDTLIHDLRPENRQAVYNRWLNCRHVLQNYEQALFKAYEILQIGMVRRGLV